MPNEKPPETQAPRPRRVFISHAWSTAHGPADRVREFVEHLSNHKDRFTIIFDEHWARQQQPLPGLMEEVERCDVVLAICTGLYRQRFDARAGGVGEEADALLRAMVNERDHPRLFLLRWEDSARWIPEGVESAYQADFRDWPSDPAPFRALLRKLIPDFGEQEAFPIMRPPREEVGSELFPWNRRWTDKLERRGIGHGERWHQPWGLGSLGTNATSDILDEFPGALLLGESGLGKSVELRRLFESLGPDTNRWFVDLARVGSERQLNQELFNDWRWGAWRRSDQVLWLFLDGLDECPIPRIGNLLVHTLCRQRDESRAVLGRLRFFVAARATNLEAIVLQDQLPRVFPPRDEETSTSEPSFPTWYLFPLMEEDIRVAAQQQIEQVEPFMKGLERQGLQALAAEPLLLKALIRVYRETESLPGSRWETFQSSSALLLEAPATSMPAGVASGARRMLVVGRMAAVALLCERNAFSEGAFAHPAVLNLDDLDGYPLPFRRSRIEGDVHEHLAILRSRLFRHVGDVAWFSDRGVLEFLAAWYLEQLGMDTDELLDLASSPPNSVAPQARGLLAWLAPKHPPLMDALLERDPEALLSADGLALTPNQSRAIVASLLRLADDESRRLALGVRQHRLLARLAHAGLARQLQESITDPERPHHVRLGAVNIAMACDLVDEALMEALVRRALDPEEHPNVRRYAASHVARHGEASHCEQLQPLLDLSESEDPDQDLRGAVLRALWPVHLSFEEVLDQLESPRRQNYHGTLAGFAIDFIDSLSEEQLPAALDWYCELSDPSGKALSTRTPPFVEAMILLVQRAVLHLEDGDIGPRLVKLFRRLGTWADFPLRQELRPDLSSKSMRRPLIKLLVDSRGEMDWNLVQLHEHLLESGDLRWVAERLIDAEETRADALAERWLRILSELFRLQDDDHVGALREVVSRSDRIASRFGTLIKEENRQRLIAETKQREQERNQRAEQLKQPDEGWNAATLSRLHRVETEHPEEWWVVVHNLRFPRAHPAPQRIFEEDKLSELPGWQYLDEQQRERVVAAALPYLHTFETDPAEVLKANSYHHPSRAAYAALRLLHEHDKLPDDSAIWQRWAPIFVKVPSALNRDLEGFEISLLRQVWTHAPDELIRAFLAYLPQEVEADRHRSELHRLKHIADPAIGLRLLRALRNEDWTLQARIWLVEAVAIHQPDAAVEFGGELLSNADEAERGELLVTLLQAAPRRAWETFWPLLAEDDDLARSVFPQLVEPGFVLIKDDDPRQLLDEDRLARIYLRLLQLWPEEEDPDIQGVHWVGSREMLSHYRSSIPRTLADRGTVEAVAALEFLYNHHPEPERIAWDLERARENLKRVEWRRPTPQELMERFYDLAWTKQHALEPADARFPQL